MRSVLGSEWRTRWDAIITSAGKPAFYTDESRPFREICQETRRLMFRKVERFEPGKAYSEGCLKELMRLMKWNNPETNFEGYGMSSGSLDMATANVLYIGDSLFADLVDAKREYSWTTAAVTPEVGYEMELQTETNFILARRTIILLLHTLRNVQEELGTSERQEEDSQVLNALEKLVSLWRDRESDVMGVSCVVVRCVPCYFPRLTRIAACFLVIILESVWKCVPRPVSAQPVWFFGASLLRFIHDQCEFLATL